MKHWWLGVFSLLHPCRTSYRLTRNPSFKDIWRLYYGSTVPITSSAWLINVEIAILLIVMSALLAYWDTVTDLDCRCDWKHRRIECGRASAEHEIVYISLLLWYPLASCVVSCCWYELWSSVADERASSPSTTALKLTAPDGRKPHRQSVHLAAELWYLGLAEGPAGALDRPRSTW